MPRIRKKTSNRQSTNDRRKIQRKVRESRKKRAKEAKKNPQWKSKHKKDPGIPNDFPYKDQILAEVAQQRRIAAEEKEKRKEEKRLARQQTKETDTEDQNAADPEQNLEESSNAKSLDVGSDAIASLSAKLINPKLATKEKKPAESVHDDDDDEEAPILVNHDLRTLKAVLDDSDVLLEVLDARDPLPFRSSHLEKVMEGKKVLLVLNKIDTCPREGLAAWLALLRREHPTYLFRSATAFLPASLESTATAQGKGKAKLSLPKDDALGAEAILAQLSSWAKEKGEGSPLNVAVVGLTNAGKSSFLNSLLHKASLPVYSLPTSSRGPTTTVLPQEVTVDADGKPIRFIDTPGLTWSAPTTNVESDSLEGLRARDILLRSKGRIDRLKDPSPTITHIVSRANAEDLMLMYSLPAFTKGDCTAFLSGVARSNHLVKKRGELDLTGASKIVLRDWNTGKFARYTLPPGDLEKSKQSDPLLLTEADEKILSCTRTRKEIRKSGGLIKLLPSDIETREAVLEEPWEEEESDEGDDEVVEEGMDVDENESESEDGDGVSQGEDGRSDTDEEDEDGEDDEDREGDEDEDIEPSPPSLKQKRKRSISSVSAQPDKKVAFASHGKSKPVQSSAKVNQVEPATRSILKKAATITKSRPSKALPLKEHKKLPEMVANAASSFKNKASATNDPDAYDFKKFF